MISDRIIVAFAGFLILRVCSHPQTPPLSASLSGFCRPPPLPASFYWILSPGHNPESPYDREKNSFRKTPREFSYPHFFEKE
jgi:hypothetical protein